MERIRYFQHQKLPTPYQVLSLDGGPWDEWDELLLGKKVAATLLLESKHEWWVPALISTANERKHWE